MARIRHRRISLSGVHLKSGENFQSPGKPAAKPFLPAWRPIKARRALFGSDLNHFFAVVVPAFRARPMRQLQFMTIRALGERGRLECIMSATTRRSCLRMSAFWVRHIRSFLIRSLKPPCHSPPKRERRTSHERGFKSSLIVSVRSSEDRPLPRDNRKEPHSDWRHSEGKAPGNPAGKPASWASQSESIRGGCR